MSKLATILTISPILAMLTSCATFSDQPVATRTDSAAVCEALRPSYPLPVVLYNTKVDSPDTVQRARTANVTYREANARFNAACTVK